MQSYFKYFEEFSYNLNLIICKEEANMAHHYIEPHFILLFENQIFHYFKKYNITTIISFLSKDSLIFLPGGK